MSSAELLTLLRNSPTEKFAVFYHTAKGVIGGILSEGDEEGVKFNAADIVETAQKFRCAAVSIAHNHPTGEVRPSEKDLAATFALQDIFKNHSLTLHDHIIVGPEGKPFSMQAEGVI